MTVAMDSGRVKSGMQDDAVWCGMMWLTHWVGCEMPSLFETRMGSNPNSGVNTFVFFNVQVTFALTRQRQNSHCA